MIFPKNKFFRIGSIATTFVIVFAVMTSASQTYLQAEVINVSILNVPPKILSIQGNREGDSTLPNESLLALAAGEMTPYFLLLEIRDDNSIFDIDSVDADLYRSGVEGGQNCFEDDQNCYHLRSVDGDCVIEPISITNGIVKCRVDFAYFADATSGYKSKYPDEFWNVRVRVSDGDEVDEKTDFTFNIDSLVAIDLPGDVNFGALVPGLSSNQGAAVTFKNIGNVDANFVVSTSDLSCGFGKIPADNQRLDIVDGSYEQMGRSETAIKVGENPQTYVDIVLPARSSFEESEDTIYWTLDVPFGISGACTGSNIITGI